MIQYLVQPFRFLWFTIYFFAEFMKANFHIFADTITPKLNIEPGIVKLSLDSYNDFEITLLATLISLTPGTRVIAIKKDPAALYVHGVYAKDADVFRNELHKLEMHMIRATRLPKNVKVRDKI